MGIEDLTEIEVTIGIFDTVFVIISFIIGLKILSKYIELKRRELLTVALTWLFLSIGWWGGMLSFWIYMLFNIILNHTVYLIVANAFTSLALLSWIYSMSILVFARNKKVLLLIFLVICIPYEIVLLFLILTHPEIIGTFSGIYFLKPQLFVLPFQLFAIFTTLITGILFARQSLKSEDPKVRWKGKFLILAFISFFISIFEVPFVSLFVESVVTITLIIIFIFRFFLISSVIEYYFGFFLPDKLAQRLIK